MEYFDPLGNAMSSELGDWIWTHYGYYTGKVKRVQGPNSIACGQFCIYYLSMRLCGVNINKIYNTFTYNFKQNDVLVNSFVNKLM